MKNKYKQLSEKNASTKKQVHLLPNSLERGDCNVEHPNMDG
jgi:hypothetical protein